MNEQLRFLQDQPPAQKKEIQQTNPELLAKLGQQAIEVLRFTRSLIEMNRTVSKEDVELIKRFSADIAVLILSADAAQLRQKLTDTLSRIPQDIKRSSDHADNMESAIRGFIRDDEPLEMMQLFFALQNHDSRQVRDTSKLEAALFDPNQMDETLYVFPMSSGVVLGSLMAEAYAQKYGSKMHWTTVFPGKANGTSADFILPQEKKWKRILLLDDQISHGSTSTINRCLTAVQKAAPQTLVANGNTFHQHYS